AVPLWCRPLLGSHHSPRAVDQFRLDGRAADVEGGCEPVVVVHESMMMERARLCGMGRALNRNARRYGARAGNQRCRPAVPRPPPASAPGPDLGQVAAWVAWGAVRSLSAAVPSGWTDA